jgi:two-component system response regulator MprA
MQILVIDDDRELAGYIRSELEQEGNRVAVCYDGASGLKAAERGAFDIIVLDVTMPFLNGFDVTRRLRLQHIATPVLLLTARDAPEDVVQGLDAGADDYLVKPFSFDVLLARIRARTRVAPGDSKMALLRFADLKMNLQRREVWRGDAELHLTRTEFSVLECMLRAAPRVVSRNHLIDWVWSDREINGNNLDVFIRFLRAKLELPGLPKLLQTERGVGYVLRAMQ